MPDPNKPTGYQTLVRKCRPRQAPAKSVEEGLDSLLDLHQRRSADAEGSPDTAKISAIDQLRHQMRDELIPVFEDLRRKYEEKGVLMAMDADEFVSGGVRLVIEVAFQTYGMRMEGTATPNGIAFHEARYSNNVRGVLTTGPMLRARNLTKQAFREFICNRIGQLVRSALHGRQQTTD